VQLGAILAVLLLCGLCPVKAAFETDLAGPPTTALGGAGVALNGDAWAANRNPALAAFGGYQVGFSWSELFGLPELAREAVTVSSRIGPQPWALRAGTFGSDLYRETEFCVVAARRVASGITLGFELQSRWLYIRNYSYGTAYGATAGIVVEPHQDVTVGAVWRNLNDPRINGYKDRLAESLTIGTALRIRNEGHVVFDIVQESRHAAEFRVGAEAQVLKGLSLQVGARAEPVRPSAGLQIHSGRWTFVYAGDLHPDLGVSHEAGLAMKIGR
jgi:hypothetical protein